jgi:hypothetical protein
MPDPLVPEPNALEPHVIVTGNVIDGLSLHGPFLDATRALAFTEHFFAGDNWTIAPLTPVDDEDDEPGSNWSGYASDARAAPKPTAIDPTALDLAALSTVQITMRRDNLLAALPTAADDAHRDELRASADRMTAELTRRAGGDAAPAAAAPPA